MEAHAVICLVGWTSAGCQLEIGWTSAGNWLAVGWTCREWSGVL